MGKVFKGVRALIGGTVTVGVATVFTGMGATSLHTYYTNPQPLEVDCADFSPEKLERNWIRLTNCAAPLDEAVAIYEIKKGKERITDLYIPVFSAKEYGDGTQTESLKTSLALRTAKSEKISLWSRYEKLMASEESDSEEQLDAFLEQNYAEFNQLDTIQGVVRTGFAKLDNDDSTVKENQPMFRENFIVLDADEKPSLPFSLVKLGFGLFCFGVAAVRGLRFFARA